MPLTDEQMAIRQTGIGCSEVAAALGLSEWCTPLQLYERKLGIGQPFEDQMRFRFGNFIEAFILDEFILRDPDERYDIVRAPNTMRKGALLGHLDAWMPMRYNVQAKSWATKRGWGEPGSDDVPMDIVLQSQAEMLVSDTDLTFVPVLFGGSTYAEYIIRANAELQQAIMDGVGAFWQRVEAREPPPPTGIEEMRRLFPESKPGAVVQASSEIVATAEALHALKERIKALEEDAEDMQAKLMHEMGDAEALVCAGKIVATWKTAAPPKILDTTALKAAHPDIVAQFTKEGVTPRRFLLK